MIRINRSAKPAILDPTPDRTRNTYADLEVRRALSDMQFEKCCYCEKKIVLSELFPEDCSLEATPHTERHIEHFRPQGRPEFQQLKNEWVNLLLSCNTCNVNKGKKFDIDGNGNPLCIDPSDQNMDPEDHITLAPYQLRGDPSPDVGRLKPLNDSPQGDWTIKNIKLNESTSRKDRTAKIQSLVKDIVDYQFSPPNRRNGARLQKLQEQCLSEEEYAFVARALCRQFNIPFNIPMV